MQRLISIGELGGGGFGGNGEAIRKLQLSEGLSSWALKFRLISLSRRWRYSIRITFKKDIATGEKKVWDRLRTKGPSNSLAYRE